MQSSNTRHLSNLKTISPVNTAILTNLKLDTGGSEVKFSDVYNGPKKQDTKLWNLNEPDIIKGMNSA